MTLKHAYLYKLLSNSFVRSYIPARLSSHFLRSCSEEGRLSQTVLMLEAKMFRKVGIAYSI